MYMHVRSSTIRNNQKVEITPMPISGYTIVVCSHMEYYSVTKRSGACYNVDGPRKHYAK